MEFLDSIGLLDIIFIVILTVSIILGVVRGAVREGFALAGLGLSLFFAFKFADFLATHYVTKFFEDSRVSYVIAFAIIIVVTLFAIALLNMLVGQLLRATGLSTLNRFLGLIFGALRGTLFCTILVIIVSFIPGATSESWWKQSTLAPIFQSIAKLSANYMPEEVGGYFQSTKENIDKVTSSLKPNQLPLNLQGNSAPSAGSTEAKPTSAATSNSPIVNDSETKSILQSIENSRQESSSQPAIRLESTEAPQPSADDSRTKLILESAQ